MASNQPEIAIVIPTHKEQDYIRSTLAELVQQTACQKKLVEIIIADYDPDNDGKTREVVETEAELYDVSIRYIRVRAKGIAHARHTGITASSAPFIVCFDADTKFSRIDAVEMLVAPLRTGGILFTCCDNVFPPDEIDVNSPPATYLKACCLIQRMSPVCCLEPGLSFTRGAYVGVGGFDDVNWAEGLRLTSKIVFAYGALARQHVEDVHVWTSARRAKMLNKLGLGVFDYTNAIRGNDIHKT